MVLVGSLLLVGIVSSVGWGASLKLTGIVVGGHPESISVIELLYSVIGQDVPWTCIAYC